MGTVQLLGLLAAAVLAAGAAISPDRPNEVAFPPEEAKFVRFVIRQTAGGAACIDELEVYGPDGKVNLALASGGAKASASSCISGHTQHAVEHLNDGHYGNEFSWIAEGTGDEWAQVELAKPARVAKVVFSRDREGRYADRVPVDFEVRLSADGRQWTTAAKVAGKVAASAARRTAAFNASVPPPPPPPRLAKAGGPAAPDAAPGLRALEKDELGFVNLARGPKAVAAASSLLPGRAIHQVAHLNDGLAGNDHSWVSAGDPSWAEIDLGGVYWVYQVAFGSDSSNRYHDRAPTTFSILAATEHQRDGAAKTWTVVHKQVAGPPVRLRTALKFRPVQARWVRIAVEATSGSEGRIDEIEIFGRKDPIAIEKIGPLPPQIAPPSSKAEAAELLRYAVLGEEHAWLKAFGRADLSPRLVPYNGRVKEYPRHAGDDVLPLPPLSAAPKMDGRLDDPCWAGASRGVARVADPYDFECGPLVECAVSAGWNDDRLLLGIQVSRLLSTHAAVVSAADGRGCGVVTWTEQGPVFTTCDKAPKSVPLEGKFDASLAACEVSLPLDWFPDCRTQGIRVGLGMGGKHTPSEGRPVHFAFSPFSVAEVAPCVGNTFRVRLAVPKGGENLKIEGSAEPLAGGLTLCPGESKILTLQADRGPIGPEVNLEIRAGGGEPYALHLFRYDPVGRTLALTDEMLDRFAAKGLDVGRDREEAARLHRRHEALLSAEAPDPAAERRALLDARESKRRLFFRDPDLGALEEILFVKRHAYEPSHNYSVMLDSPWRPGGGIYRLRIPRRDGRLEPAEATLNELFASGAGIARDPMADFDLGRLWFAYRPKPEGYFHVYSMKADGGGVRQLTDGPFHDYWPCPLPQGDLAFISTRCKARYLCWRPQVAVMFRMDADGRSIRPLSFSNLSEWAPSVMSDGRIIWTRSEYIDKGADFGHTLWSIRPDGTHPELVFGNTIIQPNGYANGREVPGTGEVCCTLISHFGDLNGPIVLVDLRKGRFNPKAITSLTPEVPWPGMWPDEECFRDPVPIARDYILCSHAPRRQFGLYVIDRFGNREMLHLDPGIGSMCPTPLRAVPPPPMIAAAAPAEAERSAKEGPWGQFVVEDVYRGIEPTVKRGTVKYIRVVEEVRADLARLPNGEYRKDHEPFMNFYAAPVDLVAGPYGWPSYVAKGVWGIAPVEEDGSANFYAPAGKVLYLQVLDKDLNELQRMRSVVQLQPGEKRSCIGCHEDRASAPILQAPAALRRGPSDLAPPPWGAGTLAYEKVVQPVLDAKCVRCHDAADKRGVNLAATRDANRVPASYRTLITQGWVHYLDCGYNSGGCEKREPLTFGTVKSRLWKVLDGGHYEVTLTADERHRIKCWTDMNCPLWPDYIERTKRPMTELTARP